MWSSSIYGFFFHSFFFFFFPWLASNLRDAWAQKVNQPQKKPVLKLQVNFSRVHEAAKALTKGGWSFRAAMAAQLNMSLTCSCMWRGKSTRHLCEVLLSKICLDWFSSSAGNYQIKWFKNANWKNYSSRAKIVRPGAWPPLQRNLRSISYNAGAVIQLYYKTDWKNAQIGLQVLLVSGVFKNSCPQHEPFLTTSRGFYL